MPNKTFKGNAVLFRPWKVFTADAILTKGRIQHHRDYDHFGADKDLNVVLDSPLGKWPAGTPVHYVLDDLVTRIVRLESTAIRVHGVTADAVLTGFHFIADGIVRRKMSQSYTAQAMIDSARVGSFTGSAWLRGAGRFVARAVIV